MSGQFRILPDRGLIYVRYDGWLRLPDAEALMVEYYAHPDMRPDMKRLFDLSGLTGFDVDFPRLLAIHAENTHVYAEKKADMMMIVHAPTEVSREFGQLLVAPWRGVSGMVATVQSEEAAALAILGQPEQSFADMLAACAM